jgi:ABC-type enterochelin transport system substrate-binding protein
MLSVVPEVDTPATFLDPPKDEFITDKRRPMSEITEIFDELEDIEDELSEFEEDSEEALSFQSV